jgi:hypothetical protein
MRPKRTAPPAARKTSRTSKPDGSAVEASCQGPKTRTERCLAVSRSGWERGERDFDADDEDRGEGGDGSGEAGHVVSEPRVAEDGPDDGDGLPFAAAEGRKGQRRAPF